MALGKRKARQALLYVLLDVFGHLRVAPTPPIGQLLGGSESEFPGGGREHRSQAGPQLLALREGN